jgi:hypothetical protein
VWLDCFRSFISYALLQLWERALLGMRRYGQRVIAAETSDAAQPLGHDEHSMTVVVATLKRVKFVDASKNDVARSTRSQTPTSVQQCVRFLQ